jgi:hypothetical protein
MLPVYVQRYGDVRQARCVGLHFRVFFYPNEWLANKKDLSFGTHPLCTIFLSFSVNSEYFLKHLDVWKRKEKR